MNVYFILCSRRSHGGWCYCPGVCACGLERQGGPVTLPLSLAHAWWRDVDFEIGSSL